MTTTAAHVTAVHRIAKALDAEDFEFDLSHDQLVTGLRVLDALVCASADARRAGDSEEIRFELDLARGVASGMYDLLNQVQGVRSVL